MNDRPRIRVALPWVRDALAEAHAAQGLPALPSLGWLAGRGDTVRFDTPWRQWLLQAVDAGVAAALDAWPAGPSLAAAAGATAGTARGWGVAQPVHFATGLDHLRLAPLADAVPSAEEAETLASSIRGHFAGDAFELLDFVDGAWVVRCEDAIDASTRDPADLVGRNVHDYMPGGQHGARVRSWMNEIQMLLHEHAVNERRMRRHTLPINALWLWGFGRFETPPPPQAPALGRWLLRSDDLWLRAFWRMHGAQERTLSDPAVSEQNALVAMTQPPTSDAAEALVEVDSSLLSRLQQAMQGGRLRGLDLLIGDVAYTLDRPSRWRIWRRPAAAADLVP